LPWRESIAVFPPTEESTCAHHPAAERHHQVAALDARLYQCLADLLEHAE
jgi:hypothetical protein